MSESPPSVLPIGRYWIDVSNEPTSLGTWLGFLDAAKGFVHVEVTETDDDFSFSIFTTSKALIWPEGIGTPTEAPPNIKSRADTVQRPDPVPDLTDQISTPKELLAGVGDTVKLAVVVVVALVAIKLLVSGRRGKK